MKSILIFLVLFTSLAALAYSQQPTSTESALGSKTRKQLIACFSNLDACGAESKWNIADILGRPGNKAFLLSEFRATKDADQKLGIIYALYRINDPEVATFFKTLVKQKFDDGEALYYPLNYLAKRCDSNALRLLSGNGKGGYPGYPGCLQWGTTVELFGQCKYRPAVPYLINSLDAACLNIGIAADDSLRKMFPDIPTFDSPEKEQAYFMQRVREKEKSKP